MYAELRLDGLGSPQLAFSYILNRHTLQKSKGVLRVNTGWAWSIFVVSFPSLPLLSYLVSTGKFYVNLNMIVKINCVNGVLLQQRLDA